MRTKLNLEPSRRSLVLFTSTAALGLVLCCVVGVVGLNLLGNARAELAKKQTQVDDGRQIAKRLADSRDRYHSALTDLKTLEASVSTRSYIPTLLKQMEQMGESVNLKVQAVRPVAETKRPPAKKSSDSAKSSDGKKKVVEAPPAPTFPKQRIDITTEGTFADGLSFLYRLTTFPKIVTVNSVEMSPIGARQRMGVGGPGQLSIKFNVTAFILDESSKTKKLSGGKTRLSRDPKQERPTPADARVRRSS